MISVGSMAVGYLLLNLFSKSTNVSGDVCSTLFGSTAILTLSKTDVWLCGIVSVLVLLIHLLVKYREPPKTAQQQKKEEGGTDHAP